MITFDAGSGEVCQIRRVRTNTPLQALVTLNDTAFLEAAGALAARMEDVEGTLEQRIAHGFRLVLIRRGKTNPRRAWASSSASATSSSPSNAASDARQKEVTAPSE